MVFKTLQLQINILDNVETHSRFWYQIIKDPILQGSGPDDSKLLDRPFMCPKKNLATYWKSSCHIFQRNLHRTGKNL